jgi:hypothetical protein
VLAFAGVALAAACPPPKRATAVCDARLRPFDGTDVFALSPGEVLRLSRALTDTDLRLRRRFPHWALSSGRPLRLVLRRAGHLGRVYSRAYREDPSDNSLPQEAAFENALLDLQRAARKARLRACAVKVATP